jgi:hypothetical protein
MKQSYLEVTFRSGRPLAAYMYLPRRPTDRSHRTVRAEKGMLIDFNRAGRPIGIEITAPGKVTLAAMNRVMRGLGMPELKRADLKPLKAA